MTCAGASGGIPALGVLPQVPEHLDPGKYHVDGPNRIVFAVFGAATGPLTRQDRVFLLDCFERDDVTVIVRGLHGQLTPVFRASARPVGVLEQRRGLRCLANASFAGCTAAVSPATHAFAPHRPHLWTWDYMLRRCSDLMWHQFKSFRRNPDGSFAESSWRSMTLHDYNRYLIARRGALAAKASPSEGGAAAAVAVVTASGRARKESH